MENSLKDAVDKQLAIAKLEEKLHITFGELDTPESKFKSLMDAVISMNTKLMIEALLALGANPNATIELLKDESTPEEVKTEAKKTLAFHAGGPVITDIMETLTLISEIFRSNND